MIPVYNGFLSPTVFDILKDNYYKYDNIEKINLFRKYISYWVGTENVIVSRNNKQIWEDLLFLNKKDVILSPFISKDILFVINKLKLNKIFVDINFETGLIDENEIKKLNLDNKILILSSFYGYPPNIKKFLKFNLPILIDGESSFVCKSNGKFLSEFNLPTVFLLDEKSVINSNNLTLLCNYELNDYENITKLDAIIGLENLNHLFPIINLNKNIYYKYLNIFSKEKNIKFLKIDKDVTPCYNCFPILINNRDNIIKKLNNIIKFNTIDYISNNLTEKAKKFNEQCLILPCGPWVTESNINKIFDIIKENI